MNATRKTCSVCGAGGKITRGWCGPHYQRWRRHGDPTAGGPDAVRKHMTAEEVLAHHGWTVTETGCWEWGGSLNHNGYGYLDFQNERWLAHRFMYAQRVGPIPDGHLIRHGCDNRPCVNPDHLAPGLEADNTQDAVTRHRFANGARAGGAKLTDDDVADIRCRYAAGESSKDLGAEYGVHRNHVASIVANRFWKAPTNPPIEGNAA